MSNRAPSVALIVKGDKFNQNHCLQNALENEQMRNILYIYTVGSLMYAQVRIKPDSAFAGRMM
jgi:hypothetical protein